MALSSDLLVYANHIWRRFPEVFIALGAPSADEVFDLRSNGTWKHSIVDSKSERVVEVVMPRRRSETCEQEGAVFGEFDERSTVEDCMPPGFGEADDGEEEDEDEDEDEDEEDFVHAFDDHPLEGGWLSSPCSAIAERPCPWRSGALSAEMRMERPLQQLSRAVARLEAAIQAGAVVGCVNDDAQDRRASAEAVAVPQGAGEALAPQAMRPEGFVRSLVAAPLQGIAAAPWAPTSEVAGRAAEGEGASQQSMAGRAGGGAVGRGLVGARPAPGASLASLTLAPPSALGQHRRWPLPLQAPRHHTTSGASSGGARQATQVGAAPLLTAPSALVDQRHAPPRLAAVFRDSGTSGGVVPPSGGDAETDMDLGVAGHCPRRSDLALRRGFAALTVVTSNLRRRFPAQSVRRVSESPGARIERLASQRWEQRSIGSALSSPGEPRYHEAGHRSESEDSFALTPEPRSEAAAASMPTGPLRRLPSEEGGLFVVAAPSGAWDGGCGAPSGEGLLSAGVADDSPGARIQRAADAMRRRGLEGGLNADADAEGDSNGAGDRIPMAPEREQAALSESGVASRQFAPAPLPTSPDARPPSPTSADGALPPETAATSERRVGGGGFGLPGAFGAHHGHAPRAEGNHHDLGAWQAASHDNSPLTMTASMSGSSSHEASLSASVSASLSAAVAPPAAVSSR